MEVTMASISKHKGGWRAIVHRRSAGLYKSKVFKRKYDAERWAREIESKIDDGVFVDRSAAEETTLAEALDRYLDEISVHRKGNGYSRDKSNVKTIKRFPIAKLTLAKIRAADVARFRDARAKEVGPNSVRLAMALISHLFTIAIKEWDMDYLNNPVMNTRKVSVAHTARNRRLNGDEEGRLIAACKKYGGFIDPVVKLALETAMRRGEIASIRWKDVDLNNRIVHLYDTKNGEHRDVPLSSAAVRVFKQLSNIRRIDGYVFGITADAITRAFSRVCTRAKDAKGEDSEPIQNLRFHDLRHEATSRLFEMGLRTEVVKAITGHKTYQMLDRYTHLRPEDIAKMLG